MSEGKRRFAGRAALIAVALVAARGPALAEPALKDDPRYIANLQAIQERPLEPDAPLGTRIINGAAVPPEAFLDTVAVVSGRVCSGVLISPDAVLTAAHCFCSGKPRRVLLGLSISQPIAVFRVDQARSRSLPFCADHPFYGKDISVLFLQTPVPAQLAQPARLADLARLDQNPDGRAVGFGLTETGSLGHKLLVDLPIASHRCAGVNRGLSDAHYYGCAPQAELIAGQKGLNRDTCRGDSGGPLYLRQDGSFKLAALTARGIYDGECGDGGVYTLITDEVRQWLRNLGVSYSD